MEAITSVVGRASNREVFGGALAPEPTALQAAAAAAARVRWLMLALLARFHRPASDLPDHTQARLLYYKVNNVNFQILNGESSYQSLDNADTIC